MNLLNQRLGLGPEPAGLGLGLLQLPLQAAQLSGLPAAPLLHLRQPAPQ